MLEFRTLTKLLTVNTDDLGLPKQSEQFEEIREDLTAHQLRRSEYTEGIMKKWHSQLPLKIIPFSQFTGIALKEVTWTIKV